MLPSLVVKALVYRGTLTYPNDVASTLVIPVHPGPVTVYAHWATTANLVVALKCGTADKSTAVADTSIGLRSNVPACSISLVLDRQASGAVVSYQLVVRSLRLVASR